MTYEETVSIIVNKAINSVVFIDENAKEPYSLTDTTESKRCVELYKLFRENGMSMSIYQYDEKTYINHRYGSRAFLRFVMQQRQFSS